MGISRRSLITGLSGVAASCAFGKKSIAGLIPERDGEDIGIKSEGCENLFPPEGYQKLIQLLNDPRTTAYIEDHSGVMILENPDRRDFRDSMDGNDLDILVKNYELSIDNDGRIYRTNDGSFLKDIMLSKDFDTRRLKRPESSCDYHIN